nr:MAG TPA: hypothetical protein [Caudoviricetes sp.]
MSKNFKIANFDFSVGFLRDFHRNFFQKVHFENSPVKFDTPPGTDFQTEKPDRQILKFCHDFDWILKRIRYFLTI